MSMKKIRMLVVIIMVFYIFLSITYFTYKDIYGSPMRHRLNQFTEYMGNGDIYAATELLNEYPQLATDSSALQHAVINAETDLVKKIIAMGADVNAYDESFKSNNTEEMYFACMPPIFIVVECTMKYKPEEAMQIAELLLKNGADISITDYIGKTAYDYAVEEGYTEIAEVIARYQKNNES